MEPRVGSESGQSTVEQIGLVLLLGALLAALAAGLPVGGAGGSVAASLSGAFGRTSSASAGAEPRPPEGSWAAKRALVDRYMAADLAEFLAYRASPHRDPRLDYSSDLCSAPLVGSSGASFDFTRACLRHDFGYRNYDRLGLFRRRKDAVDARFLADMRDHCATRPESERDRCRAWARIFHEAVSRFGFLSGHG